MNKKQVRLHFYVDVTVDNEELQELYKEYVENKESNDPDYTFDEFVEAFANEEFECFDFFDTYYEPNCWDAQLDITIE